MMPAPNLRKSGIESGFTIIELLIATAVFAVILLVITAAVLQFSKQYYKGVVSSTTQGVARGLIDDVTRSIQFNGGGVTAAQVNGSSKGWCVGSGKLYSYVLGTQVESAPAGGQSLHGLVSETTTMCNGGTSARDVKNLPANLANATPAMNNGRELLGQRMRLSKFDITGIYPDPYTLTVRVVYGDDDLLCSPSMPGDCDNPNSTAGVTANKDDLVCRLNAGSQYCAVSELSTTVKSRK